MTSANSQFNTPTVLLVDDDPGALLLMRAALSQAGFAVLEAVGGAEALTVIAASQPDVVLLDVEMPDLNGYETCIRIKALPQASDIPVIMVTSHNDEESVARAYDAGAEDFITKPVNLASLPYHVRYVTRTAAAHREHGRNARKLSAILSAMPDMIVSLDRNGDFVDEHTSAVFTSLVGQADIQGKNIFDVVGTENVPAMSQTLETVWSHGGVQSIEYSLAVGGARRYFEARVVPNGDDQVLAIVRDVTERRKAEERIRYLAFNDVLTGLPNRASFEQRLASAIQDASARKDSLSVLVMDLDRFKRINDTLGHSIGDTLLMAVADRLRRCARNLNNMATPGSHPHFNLARIGGDKFLILQPGNVPNVDPASAARRILKELSHPFRISDHEVLVTPSIGIAIYPADAEEPETLIKHADAAMSHAKSARNSFQFFKNSMNLHTVERLQLESELRRAVAADELFLVYQPQCDVVSGRITGVEALVRWAHPTRGLVPPLDFIPIAEETGLILSIGDWVLEAACVQNQAWVDAGLPPVCMGVNISGHQFRAGGVAASVNRALATSGMSAEYLELELTETVLMQDASSTIEELNKLRAIGIQFAVDDFGTGYSSLSYLKRFPLTRIKIDRAFVRDVIDSPDDAAISSAIIAMAHGLKFKTIAEGVETREQLEFLRQKGCDEYQGYLLSKPVSADEMAKMLGAEGSVQMTAQPAARPSNVPLML